MQASTNANDSTLHVTDKYNWINENLASYVGVNDHNLASYLTCNHSWISEISAIIKVPSTRSGAYDLPTLLQEFDDCYASLLYEYGGILSGSLLVLKVLMCILICKKI